MATFSKASTYLLLISGMACFGSATPVSKFLTDYYNPIAGAGLRLLIAALFFLPFIIHNRKEVMQLARQDWYILAAIALIGVIGFTLLMFYGMQRISGVGGSIVMATTPAITALAAWLFMDETLGWRKITALLLAVGGVLVLQLGGREDNSTTQTAWLGIAFVFGAICCEACYTLLGKKATDSLSPLLTAGLSSLLAAIGFLPFLIWKWPKEGLPTAAGSWAAMLWWGAGTMALGSILWYRGVSKTEGSEAAVFMGVMPISALVLSYVLLGEQFRWIHLAGFSVVLAGLALIIYSHQKNTA